MITEETQASIQKLNVTKDILISAPIEVVWETVLEPVGEFANQGLKLEAWPGGRWYRDLGNNAGHLWGHVQVIKPPKLLEIVGPMMMSYAVASHLQYRLTEEPAGVRLKLVHTAIGLITDEHRTGVDKGWEKILAGIRDAAQSKSR